MVGLSHPRLRYYYGKIPEDYILKSRDVILTMTDLSKEGDTLGFPALIPKDSRKNYLHNQRIGLAVFKNSFRWFTYYLMTSFDYRSWIVGGATGTTVKHTSPTKIENYNYALPTDRLLDYFDKSIAPLYNVAEKRLSENLSLIQLSSLLLSKMATVTD